MPIFEYICQLCGAKFEILQRSNPEEKTACPACGAKEVKKVFSVFGFSSAGKFVSSSPGVSCSTCGHKDCSGCG